MNNVRIRNLKIICFYNYLINTSAEGLCCAFIWSFDFKGISLNEGMFVPVTASWK